MIKNAASNWKKLAERAIQENRASNMMKDEWLAFSKEQVEILRSLHNATDIKTLLNEAFKARLLDEFKDDDFMVESFICVIDWNHLQLSPGFQHMLDICIGSERWSQLHWKNILQSLLIYAVEEERSAVLSDLLSLAYDKKPNDPTWKPILGTPMSKIFNDPALIRACEMNNFHVVKPLVHRGYRLKTGHLTKRAVEEMDSWQRYTEIPFLRSKYQDFLGSRDEIADLTLLKAMAQPSYIIACYLEVLEQTNLQDDGNHCQCLGNAQTKKKGHKPFSELIGMQPSSEDSNVSQNSSSSPVGLKSVMMYQLSTETFHFCPAHSSFKPDLNCNLHLECNDPIYRCFEIATIATECARMVPEFRSEYRAVADKCRKTSVELVDCCKDTAEVTLLLTEHAGAKKHFRNARYLENPRLRVAVLQNHKSFVGHMFCQQMLRQQWHGHVNWKGKSWTYKFMYILIQVLLCPVYILWATLYQCGRDVSFFYPDLPPHSEFKNWFKKLSVAYIHFCSKNKHSLDAPLNRFINHMGLYSVFLITLNAAVLHPINEVNNWQTISIFCYACGFLLNDLHTLTTVRSWKALTNFWFLFDLLSHFLLLVGISLRTHMIIAYPCELADDSLLVCSADVAVRNRETVDLISGIIFAFAAVQAYVKLIYYMQLSERAGPVVMNISRIAIDIVTFGGVFFLLFYGFSLGLVFIANVSTVISDTTMTFGTNLTDVQAMIVTLGWAVLEPGSNEDFAAEGVKGYLANYTFYIYQVAAVIVLMNLLIAVMSSRIQTISDQKDLYWIFSRTEIWVQYFDIVAMYPAPFSCVSLLWLIPWIIQMTLHEIATILRLRSKTGEQDTPGTCKFRFEEVKRRKAHAGLMSELIQRYFKRLKQADKNEVREQHEERLKQEIAQIRQDVAKLMNIMSKRAQ